MARRTQGAFSSRPSSWEEFHTQPVAIQNNVLFNKPRAALVTIPALTDNPLFETSQEECRRISAPRLSLEESHFKPVPRRTGSLSLSAKDYEGIWRAVQEDVSRSSREAKTPLEDFKEFRQKLALLKQDMTGPAVARSGLSCSESTRSLNISPSRPTSPLKRLSVIASRKAATASSLNPQQRVPPSVKKIAVSMRAEGLFKLPSPASISPVAIADHSAPVQRRFPVSSQRGDQFRKSWEVPVSVEGRIHQSKPSRVEQLEASKPGGQERIVQSRKPGELVYTCTGREIRANHFTNCGAFSSFSERRSSAPPAFSALKPAKAATQSKKSSSRDWKVRCISIPRPVCYSPSITD